MASIGKLLALLNLFVGLGVISWSVNVYVQRPMWFEKAVGPVDKGNSPLTFEQLKGEIDALNRAALVTSGSWGTGRKLLEDREKVRADRKAAYAERLRWARAGNPKDLTDPANAKSPGKGFYEPVIDPGTGLHDLTLVGGLPKGKAVVGTDGAPLPGLDGLLGSVAGDVKQIGELTKQIGEQQATFDALSVQVLQTEDRAIRMNVIRDSVLAELFYLDTFEADAESNRATVLRRQKQLRGRLAELGLLNP